MDVTGPRIEQIPMLVSNEDQQKRSKCDKQMMVQCNENYQRPSWHKSNTKSSSWPVPKAEKDYSCADKENVDPAVEKEEPNVSQNSDTTDFSMNEFWLFR